MPPRLPLVNDVTIGQPFTRITRRTHYFMTARNPNSLIKAKSMFDKSPVELQTRNLLL